MAADVSSEILITKDLLGGLSQLQEKGSHERCSSLNSPLSCLSSETKQNHQQFQTNPDADSQGLNLSLNHPPSSSTSTPQMNLFFEEPCLDLKLQSSGNYQNVCTLDKVKSALKRAKKDKLKKRTSPPEPVPVSTSTTTISNFSSSPAAAAMFAAGCPGCLLYVITLKTNPKCPRCNSTVPSPLLVKKAKIDLNASI